MATYIVVDAPHRGVSCMCCAHTVAYALDVSSENDIQPAQAGRGEMKNDAVAEGMRSICDASQGH